MSNHCFYYWATAIICNINCCWLCLNACVMTVTLWNCVDNLRWFKQISNAFWWDSMLKLTVKIPILTKRQMYKLKKKYEKNKLKTRLYYARREYEYVLIIVARLCEWEWSWFQRQHFHIIIRFIRYVCRYIHYSAYLSLIFVKRTIENGNCMLVIR